MERILVEGCKDAKQKTEEVFDCCRVESKKEMIFQRIERVHVMPNDYCVESDHCVK